MSTGRASAAGRASGVHRNGMVGTCSADNTATLLAPPASASLTHHTMIEVWPSYDELTVCHNDNAENDTTVCVGARYRSPDVGKRLQTPNRADERFVVQTRVGIAGIAEVLRVLPVRGPHLKHLWTAVTVGIVALPPLAGYCHTAQSSVTQPTRQGSCRT